MKKYNLHRSDDFFIAGSYGSSERELTSHISYWQKYIQIGSYYDVLRPAVSGANKVCVYGLSFSEVDYPYLQWIAEKNRNPSRHRGTKGVMTSREKGQEGLLD